MDPNLNRSSLSEGWTFTSVQNPSTFKRKPLSSNPYCALSSSAFFHLDALVKMCEVRVQLQNNCYKELPAAVSVERSLGSRPVANAGTQSGKCFVCNWQIADKQPKLVLERSFGPKRPQISEAWILNTAPCRRFFYWKCECHSPNGKYRKFSFWSELWFFFGGWGHFRIWSQTSIRTYFIYYVKSNVGGNTWWL